MVVARLRIPRAALFGLSVLLSGCAGWSSWEDGRGSEVTPQRPVGADDYMVVRGDTVYSIAFRHSLDYRELARWNGIGADYLIRPGQVLRLKPPVDARPRRQVVGEIESVAVDDIQIGKPQPVVPNSPPTEMPEPDSGASAVTPSVAFDWVWPTAGNVVRTYGQSGARGIDVAGAVGQPVVAAAPGRVVYSGNALKGYGELIIIKHDELYLSAYGYNRTRHVKEGDVVTAGQPIAEMGRGPENKAILHFEIRRKGKPIDPLGKLPTQTAARGS